jgi:predicted AAA+ superfamily ATPase
MVRSVASGLLLNSGHLLENLVFNILRRRHEQVHYLKTRTGLEVDFVVAPRGKRRELVQVCETLVDPHTRARELKSLSAGMLELGITTALLVTRGETAEIEVEGGTVRVLPAWAFALEVEG